MSRPWNHFVKSTPERVPREVSPERAAREDLERATPEDQGAVAVTVALLLVGLLSFGALTIDISSLLMVRNELQNAADAGALAASRRLYLAGGNAVYPGANAVGVAAAQANSAQNIAVELNGNPSTNSGDVQRGHWKWSDRTFTPNASLLATTLNDVTNAELDADPNFINAVRVRVRRQATPARSFLSHLIGFDNFQMQAEAIGYIGFAGSLLPDEADEPIAICQQALLNAQGEYSCSTGRMINSGGGATHNTAGWTNFTQEPCETASKSSTQGYVGCPSDPSPEITLQVDMGTTGGQIQNLFDDFRDCWVLGSDSDADGRADTAYNMTLPVITCPGNNVGNCSKLVGAVNVNMIWMIRQAQANYNWVPTEMTGPAPFPDWECPDSITGGEEFDDLTTTQKSDCWLDFIAHFNLVNYDGVSISTFSRSDLNKTMYFLPDCATHVPVGVTAGPNLGVLAKIPVLID